MLHEWTNLRGFTRASTIIVIALFGSTLHAQNAPPFFGGGVVAFDPEVSVIRSGALLSGQATVSADQRYVTINGQATNAGLKSLQTFPVVSPGPQGFVGGIALPSGTPVASAVPAAGAGAAPSPQATERAAKSWILTRQGMYLVKAIK